MTKNMIDNQLKEMEKSIFKKGAKDDNYNYFQTHYNDQKVFNYTYKKPPNKYLHEKFKLRQEKRSKLQK